jgi:hypothetical protein
MVEKLGLEGGKPARRRKFPEYHAIVDGREIQAVTRDDLNDIIEAVEKVSSTFLARAADR